jgi:DNA-binding response OmpR family regulator
VKILIADDNPVFRSVLEAMLTNWRFSVVAACDGEEAWQILGAEDGPRLAILDWMMPGMEGVEVCRLARARFGRDVYILIVTAKTESEDLVAAMKAGADDYVTKPFKSQELRFRLAAACRILDLEEQRALLLGQALRRHGRGVASPHAPPPAPVDRYRVRRERTDLLRAGEVYSPVLLPSLISPEMLPEVK